MKTSYIIIKRNSTLPSLSMGRQGPNQPQKNDPFKKEENDNDATRIRPGVNDPAKIDPTKIDNPPSPPNIPSPPTTPNPVPEPSEPPGQQ